MQFDQVSVNFGAVGIPDGLPGIHISMWLVLPIAGLLTMLAGHRDRPADAPAARRLPRDRHARLRRDRAAVRPERATTSVGFDLTHGTFGITPIDSLGFGVIGAKLGLPESFRQSSERSQWYFWTAVVILLITVFCSVRLRDSRLGRAWIAIREDETAAAAMGIPLMRTKTWAYAIGAFFGGVAGAFYASFQAGAFPADFYFNISVFLLCMVILGGMGSVWGVLLGGMILGLPQRRGPRRRSAPRSSSPASPSSRTSTRRKYQFGIYGIIIVLMMLFRPDGPDPRTAAQDRDGGGRPRHAVLRRAARGHAHRPGPVR